MGLYVNVFCAEDLLRPLDGKSFDDVRKLAAAVIPPAGIALGVFIGEDRALRFEDGPAYVVFLGDKDYLFVLPAPFPLDRIIDLRVDNPEIIIFHLSLNLPLSF